MHRGEGSRGAAERPGTTDAAAPRRLTRGISDPIFPRESPPTRARAPTRAHTPRAAPPRVRAPAHAARRAANVVRLVPTFSLAALWNSAARPANLVPLVEGMGARFVNAKNLALVVDRGAGTANLELRLELPYYPRVAVEALMREVEKTGGVFVELWRLPKPVRDAVRTRFFSLAPTPQGDFGAAARALEGVLGQLSRGTPTLARAQLEATLAAATPPPAPRGAALVPPPPPPAAGSGDDAPLDIDFDAPPRPPPEPELELDFTPAPAAGPAAPLEDVPPPGAEARRSQRFDVDLEVEFHTELEFVLEHAVNISNGGLFVRTELRPELDSAVNVAVTLPNGARLQGQAVVAHHRDGPDGGVGLAFVSEDPAFLGTLDAYLASLAGSHG